MGSVVVLIQMVKPLAVLILGSAGRGLQRAAPTPPPAAVFTKYCTICHNAKLKTGGFVLDTSELQHVGAHAEVWEKVVQKLRTESMPPARMPRPDEATYNSTAAWLETALDRASAEHVELGKLPLAASAEPHRIRERHSRPAGRWTRCPRRWIIRCCCRPDNASSGFDNIADLLFVSPTAMESYLEAARKISRLAVGDPTMPVMVNTYRLSGEHTQDVHVQGLPFGTRGGLGVRTDVPLDGDYVFKMEFAGAPREPRSARDHGGWRARAAGGGRREDRNRRGSRGFRRAAEAARDPRAVEGRAAHDRRHFCAEGSRRATKIRCARACVAGARNWPSSIVTISGPYNGQTPGDTPSRRADFRVPPTSAQPAEETACAKRILVHAGTAGLSAARDGRRSAGRACRSTSRAARMEASTGASSRLWSACW